MAKVERGSMKLQKNHTWSAKPGHSVFVIDRGAVRFDIPKNWIIQPDTDSVRIHDRKPPHDDAVIAASYLRLPPYDFSGLPVADMVAVANEGDERPIHTWGEIVSAKKDKIDYAWRQMQFVDPKEHREAYSRLLVARQETVQALITMEFWVDQTKKYSPIWDTIIETLHLNDYIADPTKGPWGRG